MKILASAAAACLLAAMTAGAQASRWYRGNTHMHTNRSDGELTPSASARWYHDNGYDYIVLTDHRVFLQEADISIPGRRPDFLIIPGEEFNSLHAFGHNHTSIMGSTAALGDIATGTLTQSEMFDRVHALATSKGGFPILNHPTWHTLVPASEFLKMKAMKHFELFNGCADTDSYGIFGTGMPPIEALWDSVLSNGGKFYGVGSDDSHQHTPRPHACNPMTGWTMIRAQRLDVAALIAAYKTGDFYATNGVMLKDLSSTLGLYKVAIDRDGTLRELARRDTARFVNSGRPVKTGLPGWRIEFYGPRGRLLKAVTGDTATLQVTNDLAYVRARATYLRLMSPASAPYEDRLKQREYISANGITREEYHAWGQPFFTDARREGPALVFGCMDRSYFEFNPAANVSEPGACRTPGTSIQMPRSGDPAQAGLVIRVSPDLGDYSIHIRSLDGRGLATLAQNAARLHEVGKLPRYGFCVIEIRGRNRVLTKRIHLR